MFYLWPVVQYGISQLGVLVLNSGYAGTWVYGILERALIPFGLHPCFLYAILADRTWRFYDN